MPERSEAGGATGRRSRRREIRLGSMGGFEISLDYSWFLIFVLIIWTLTARIFPSEAPGLSPATYLLMGALGTTLFFASLLGHELAHSYVARWKGIGVEGITLFVFGGMAKTTREADSPGDEFQIAGVGPLASFAFAGLFYAAEALGRWMELGPAYLGVTRYMWFVNLALAIFNLLPGFPLDGGRLLRAIVWKITSDVRTATRVAAAGGRLLGYTIIGLGVFTMLMQRSVIGGLWFVFIGWFLGNAASKSYRHLILHDILANLPARHAMTPNPQTVGPGVTIHELVYEYFLKRPHGAFPVTADGTVIGLITLSQVREIPREEWPRRTVAEVMTPRHDGLFVAPDTPLTTVLRRMSENRMRRVLVAREWRLVGIITGGDLGHWLERAGLAEP